MVPGHTWTRGMRVLCCSKRIRNDKTSSSLTNPKWSRHTVRLNGLRHHSARILSQMQAAISLPIASRPCRGIKSRPCHFKRPGDHSHMLSFFWNIICWHKHVTMWSANFFFGARSIAAGKRRGAFSTSAIAHNYKRSLSPGHALLKSVLCFVEQKNAH